MIADDHQMVREGVKSALADLGDALDIFEAEDLDGIYRLLDQGIDLDLILLDLKMPGMKGIETLQALKQAAPDVAVAILSAYNHRNLVQQALDSGADGYIPKASRKEVMLNAIRLVLAGEIYIPSLLLSADPAEETPQEPDKPAPHPFNLTARQQEIFALMQTGLSNKEIAREAGCTEGTVKAHVTAILKSLSVTSRAKAIALKWDT
ncbi:response regulator [Sneathiella chinensis]|uniref:response regulator n=1 Tax=Sneathiella chinensis TaxID=349750 RepID=UPI0024E0FE17|nr:response regulator transcription factor [Sneathiella chinensis]